MVAWGMGHNLEKNLRRVQTYRERGQLDKALKQLQEWARRHPDTPHYQFEAAVAAFDLKDWSTGVSALRTLLRNLPDTREKVLSACEQRFEETPAVPLAEFLVEASLADQQLPHIVELIQKLEPADQAIYARKVSMRIQSAEATPQTPEKTLRNGKILQVLLCCALEDGSAIEQPLVALLKSPDATTEAIEALVETAGNASQGDMQLRAAHSRCLIARGAVADATQGLVDAARRDAELRKPIQTLLESLDCTDEDRGRWLLGRGDLALIERDGHTAADLFIEAADADATIRDSLLDRLSRVDSDETLNGREELLKLRLRLLVVQKKFDQVAELSQQLIEEGFAQPQEMRALLGEGQADQLPSEMLVVCAETALHDGDIAATATHLNEIADSDEASLVRVLAKIDQLLPEWEESTKLQLVALRVMLLARMKRKDTANEALAQAWEEFPTEIETLVAITDRCFERVEPQLPVLRSAIAACADAGDAMRIKPIMVRLLPEPEDDDGDGANLFGGSEESSFSQDALSLDLGGFGGGGDETEENAVEINSMLVEVLEENPDRAPQILALLDATATSTDLQRRLRHSLALAALWSERFDRALPEFAVMLMMAPTALTKQVGRQFDVALDRFSDQADLLMARADLLAESGSESESVSLLARALTADPQRAEELIGRFDSLLERVDGDEAPALWEALAEALFQVRRFDRLDDICVRAHAELPEECVTPFIVLRVRMWLLQGRFSETLQSIQQFMVSGQLAPPIAVELLEEAVEANPASPVALLMLGQAATRADNPGRAFDAYVAATKLDTSLEDPVAAQIQQIAQARNASAELLLRIGSYYRNRADLPHAAAACDRALELDPEFAERILGEFRDELSDSESDIAILMSGARAARLSGQVKLGCDYLMRVHKSDSRRFEGVLAEFRMMRECFEHEILAAEGMVRVLLDRTAPDAAVQVLVETAEKEGYAHEDRVALLEEFHAQLPNEDRLGLCLAERLAEANRLVEARSLLAHLAERGIIDAPELAQASEAMLRIDTENAELRLLHHDLLIRAGRPEEALHALPVPASMEPSDQQLLSERLAARTDIVFADGKLALSYARSLEAQSRREEALDVLASASTQAHLDDTHPLWTEWARLLHESGRDAEGREIMLAHASSDEARREAYRTYGLWSEERIERELEALRQRHEAARDDEDIALQLAESLLKAERAHEARQLLLSVEPCGSRRGERGLLLGRVHLVLERADLAEAILLDAIQRVSADSVEYAEAQFRLAECADRLGRPAQATARLQSLLGHPKYQSLALARARETYARTLREVAGESCVTLSAVSTL